MTLIAIKPRFALLTITLLAVFARAYAINSQLWLDEINTVLGSIRYTSLQIAIDGVGGNTHVLNSLLARWCLVMFGESPIVLRLPAALFGVASVPMLYVLAKQFLSRHCSLFIAALFALSYHHIFFSQNTRGYSILIFFFLLTSYLFMRIAQERNLSISLAALYAAMTVLLCYSQPFGVFVPAAQFLIALWLRLKPDERKPFPLGKFAVATSAAAVLTLVLYGPFIEGALRHAMVNIVTPQEGPRLGLWLLLEILEGLSAAFYGPAGVAVLAVFGLAGLITLYRKSPIAVFVLLLPICLQGFAFVAMGVGIHPRYFAIVLPLVYLTGGFILFTAIDKLLALTSLESVATRNLRGAMLAVLVALSAVPLKDYYRYPKQDFIGALHLLSELSQPDDVKVGLKFVGKVMNEYYHANLTKVDTLGELKRYERSGRPVWVITSLERIVAAADPGLIEHLRENYVLVRKLPGTVGDGAMRIYLKRD